MPLLLILAMEGDVFLKQHNPRKCLCIPELFLKINGQVTWAVNFS